MGCQTLMVTLQVLSSWLGLAHTDFKRWADLASLLWAALKQDMGLGPEEVGVGVQIMPHIGCQR
jgi:hypothetical protein